MDKKSFRIDTNIETPSWKITKEGYLIAHAQMTRIGVFTYIIDGQEVNELRHPKDVFLQSSYLTAKKMPITDNHPKQLVDAKNHTQLSKGFVGDKVVPNGIWLNGEVKVTDSTQVEKVQAGKAKLSCGYTTDVIDEVGEYEGVSYTKRQTNIQYNHLAIVDAGRAGEGAEIKIDSVDNGIMKSKTDKNKTKVKNDKTKVETMGSITLKNGIKYDAKDEVVVEYQELKSEMNKLKKDSKDGIAKAKKDHDDEIEKLKKDSVSKDAENTKLKDENSILQKKIDSIDVNALVNEKLDLVSKCSEYLKKDNAELIKLDDKELLTETIKAINPDAEIKEDAKIKDLTQRLDDIIDMYKKFNNDEKETKTKEQVKDVFSKKTKKDTEKNDDKDWDLKKFKDNYGSC